MPDHDGWRITAIPFARIGSIKPGPGIRMTMDDERAARLRPSIWSSSATADRVHQRLERIFAQPVARRWLARGDGGRGLGPMASSPRAISPSRRASAARHLLGLAEPPTAIIASSDQMSLATLEVARDLGLSVPGDLSLISFDDTPIAILRSKSSDAIVPLPGRPEHAARADDCRGQRTRYPTSDKGLLGGMLAAGAPVGALAGVLATAPLITTVWSQLAVVCLLIAILTLPLMFIRSITPQRAEPAPQRQRSTLRLDFAIIWASRLLVQVAGAVLFVFLLYFFESLPEPVTQSQVARISAFTLLGSFPLTLLLGRAWCAASAGRRRDRRATGGAGSGRAFPWRPRASCRPRSGQVLGGLDRAVRRAGDRQRQRHAPAGDHRMRLEAVQRLGADLDRGAAGRGIIDRVRRSGGGGEVGRGEPVDRARRLIAEQAVERAERGRRAGRAAACRRARGRAIRRAWRAARRRRAGDRGSCAAAKAARWRSASALRATAAAPARGAAPPSSPASIAAWSGLGSGPRTSGSRRGGGPWSALIAAVAGSKRTSVHARCGRRTGLRCRLLDRRGGQDARARRRAGDFADREPFAARQRRGGSSRKPRPPTDCQCSPDESRRRERRSGKARARALGQAPLPPRRGSTRRVETSTPLPPARGGPDCARGTDFFAPISAIRARLPPLVRARSPAAVPHLEVGSLPPRPRSVSSTATSAAAWQIPARPPRSACGRGAARAGGGDGAAVGVSWPSPSIAPRRGQPLARFGERGAGGGSRKGRRGVGLAPQQAGQQQARQVGLEDFGRVVRGERGGRGFLPQADGDAGPWRAARPARWVTAARLARSVTSRVRPAPRS
jgi:hypothetical protein